MSEIVFLLLSLAVIALLSKQELTPAHWLALVVNLAAALVVLIIHWSNSWKAEGDLSATAREEGERQAQYK